MSSCLLVVAQMSRRLYSASGFTSFTCVTTLVARVAPLTQEHAQMSSCVLVVSPSIELTYADAQVFFSRQSFLSFRFRVSSFWFRV